MNDIFDEMEEYAWALGDNVNAMALLQERYPQTNIQILEVADLILPKGVVACCGTGAGEVTPVKRLEMAFGSSLNGEMENATFVQFWTSPNAKLFDNTTWELFFWDQVKDREVQFEVPVVE
ncbi:TPA: hypothetical protein MCM29_005171 [Klebsiella pneumoniae]|nr:hypothetical protein [Klebsiella pneumoniae]